MKNYEKESIYRVFSGTLRAAEAFKQHGVKVVEPYEYDESSVLYRDALRPKELGVWCNWVSAKPLDAAWLRETFVDVDVLTIFVLDGIDVLNAEPDCVTVLESDQFFTRPSGGAAQSDIQVTKLDKSHLPLLDGLFDEERVTEYDRTVYYNAYEISIDSEPQPDLTLAVYGVIIDGVLVAAIQYVETTLESVNYTKKAITNPFTRPDMRGKGYGKALMNHVINSLENEVIAYENDGENAPALAMATSCGFKPSETLNLLQIKLR